MVHSNSSSSGRGMSLPERWMLCVVQCIQWIVSIIQSWIRQTTGKIIRLDTGREVRLGKQIAEGGFSYIFEAYEVNDSHNNQTHRHKSGGSSNKYGGGTTGQGYVLKRIRCPEPELLESCHREAGVHRSIRHSNLMPLLGVAVVENDYYMLFPYYRHSLRAEVNRRTQLNVPATQQAPLTSRPPWNETTALQIFLGIARGVSALHTYGRVSHRDIKLENVLCLDASTASLLRPVLMDYGSIGPLQQPVSTRKDLLSVYEQAATHTTLSYRPPELFEGGIRLNPAAADGTIPPTVIDYVKVDVWSLGCTLFALLYGASPCESEFGRSDGRLRVVECSQLKVLGGVPRPPNHSVVHDWYSEATLTLIEDMLEQDRHVRPALDAVLQRIESLIVAQGGTIFHDEKATTTANMDQTDLHHDDEDGISLMSANRLI